MKKYLLYSIIACICCVQAIASPRCLYYCGNFNSWRQPSTENSYFYEDFKLTETAENSNVFTGIIRSFDGQKMNMDYFRLHTALGDSESEVSPWHSNVLQPVEPMNPWEGEYTHHYYNSGVFLSEGIADFTWDAQHPQEPNFWYYKIPIATDCVKITVDLNNNTLYAVAPCAIVPVIDSNRTPTIADWEDLRCLSNNNIAYLAPGTHNIRLYDFWNHCWHLDPVRSMSNSITFDKQSGVYNISGWNGGLVYLNADAITLSSTLYEVPAKMALIVDYNSSVYPTTENIKYTLGLFDRIPNKDSVYESEFIVPTSDYRFKIFEVYGDDIYEYGVPDEDFLINFEDGEVYTGMQKNANNVWLLKNYTSYKVNICLSGTPGNLNQLTASIDTRLQPIYLVGEITGWREPSEVNRDFYQDYKLRATTDYAYYGEFEVPKGQAMFRFYSQLNGWDSFSYGSQFEDNSVDYNYEQWGYMPLVSGKGSYNFPNWEGGKMFIKVSLADGYLVTSFEPMAVKYADEAGISDVECCDKSNVKQAIFNLQGIYVGTSFENLLPGIYIQNGKKIYLNR